MSMGTGQRGLLSDSSLTRQAPLESSLLGREALKVSSLGRGLLINPKTRLTRNRMLRAVAPAAGSDVHTVGRGSAGVGPPLFSPRLPAGSCGWRSSLGIRDAPKPQYGAVPKFNH